MAEQAAGGGWSADIYRPAFGSAQAGASATGRGIAGGGGGDDGGSMDNDLKIYVDAQDDKTRAQNDARFAEVLAELRIIRDTAASSRSVWGAALATIAAIAGLFIGIIAIEGDRFESGLTASDTIAKVIQPVVDAQEERDSDQDRKLDRILTAVEQIRDKPQGSAPQGKN